MRRLLTGFVVAAVTAVIPVLALADNREVAKQIARNLDNSGQMSSYKIGVKCQNGTVWLRGQVSSQEQMKTALALTFQTPGVSRVINELSVGESTPSWSQLAAQSNADSENPLRGQREPAARADRVPNSFAMSAATPVSVNEMQETPQPIDGQHAVPMSRMPRGTVYMAMQPDVRGPAAPNGAPMPMYTAAARSGVAPARYDQPCLPNYAWPSYAAYPNYANVTYPKQYSPTAWPYIGPFYPYPQVPLGWRKVTLEWDSGWWFLDFKDQPASCWHR